MLFWATLAMAMYHLAYRYNILFVSDTQVDTRGLFYPRALQQLFSGIYIAEICMVGMFAVSKTPGPCVLMAIFLVFTILFQITLNRSLGPLLYGLPRTLQVEEELYQARRAAGSDPEAGTGSDDKSGPKEDGSKEKVSNGPSKLKSLIPGSRAGAEAGTEKKGNFFTRFLKPWIYADYATLRNMVPHEDIVSMPLDYSEEVEANAYWPPSVTSQTPILWIPRDPLGLSKQEVALTSKVIPISDEAATLDEKNKIQWDSQSARPPIWSEKIYY